MADIKDRNLRKRSQRLCRISTLKSSNVPIGSADLWSCPNAGSSNPPSLGSIAAEGSPRIGRISTERRSRSCASPQSASCSENSAIRPEVSGQTLTLQLPFLQVSESMGNHDSKIVPGDARLRHDGGDPPSRQSATAKKNETPNYSKSQSIVTPSLIRWSIQEVRRIAIRLARKRIQPARIIAWSLWRRAHQAAAQRAHFKANRQL